MAHGSTAGSLGRKLAGWAAIGVAGSIFAPGAAGQGPPPPPPPPPLTPLPPPPVPAQNPITEAKRVLGKILFWDEQLSMNNAMSCGTCHMPARAGSDPRVAVNPGPDGRTGTPDDRSASPGVARTDGDLSYIRDAVFGTRTQVTSRAANPMVNAAYFTDLFWDGRARTTFSDPQTGAVVIPAGGGLESQSVAPPASGVEMGHDGISWTDITDKLAGVRPLDLAENYPADVAAALAGVRDYATLFTRAFGDASITATRIAMAIATYERTLVSNQTPFDRFIAGDNAALTANQVAGLNVFNGTGRCNVCHAGSLTSDNAFRNIGLRPPAEDTGRQIVTGAPGDLGRFKVPHLRNVGLKPTFMHNGQFSNLTDVVRFYTQAPGAAPRFPQNLDPVIPTINVPGNAIPQVVDFLANGLLDPRVRDETFPFDRPRLASESAARRTSVLTGGNAGSGGVIPRILADMPGLLGTEGYRVALDGALGGARARLAVSTQVPAGGVLAAEWFIGDQVTAGSGNGQGLGTVRFNLDPVRFQAGQVLFLQWVVADAGAAGGVARSDVIRLPLFCGTGGCASVCVADYNGDHARNLDDLGDLISDYFTLPAIPAGVQPGSPASGFALGFGTPCPLAGDAPAPYPADAYRVFGYRVGFSADGSNTCPLDPSQPFPNLDHLGDFITTYYGESC